MDLRVAALKAAGSFRIRTDIASGATGERPQWQDCLDHLAGIVRTLVDRQVGLGTLTETWLNTTDSQELLMFHFFSDIAEYERDRLREGTMADLARRKPAAALGGRPTKLTTDKAGTAREGRLLILRFRTIVRIS